jgi:GNAT superfamily N-acetyltransferase
VSRSSPPATMKIRNYRTEDEPAVLGLLQASLGGGPAGDYSAEFFRWKHLANPFGPSFMLVAESDGRLVGLRAFMRWRFRSDQGILEAVRAVDTATHPDYQGRGIFSRLTLNALEALRGEIDLVFNTPNEKSLPGYLQMGWKVAGQVPIKLRIRRPIRFARRLRYLSEPTSDELGRPSIGGEPASEALDEVDQIAGLLAEVGPEDGRLATPKDEAFIRWRYAAAPSLGYRATRLHRGGRLRGLAIFRVRRRGRLWEAMVAEVIVRVGDSRAAHQLLRQVVHSANVDHVACHFAKGTTSARAVSRAGFVRAPRGLTFVVNPLRENLMLNPADLRSWSLSLGDLEVF